jgi:hypothetical protein
MNHFRRQTPFSYPPQANKRQESLSEQRYADLLRSASKFFASSVEVTDDERQAKIIGINELMTQYGLTVEDLH